MQLSPPFSISSRLLPALEIGGATIQLTYAKRAGDSGRTRYEWTIDMPDGSEHTGDDLQSGCNSGGLQEGFASLLSFLIACGESVNYQTRTGRHVEGAEMFPDAIGQWAADNSDELSMVSAELEETERELIAE